MVNKHIQQRQPALGILLLVALPAAYVPVPICKGLMSLYHTWHSKCKAPLQNDRKCAKIFGEI